MDEGHKAKISHELGYRLSAAEEEAIDFTLCVSFGFEHGLTKVVAEYGLMVGYLFPDAVGWVIVPTTHEYDLEKSQTFSKIYRPLLALLDQKYGNRQDKHSLAIQRELAGTYPN